MSRFYQKQNVYEAAKERMAFLYDEFDEVIVSISGGKDSSVIYHLAMEVAREKGRLPLNVMWLDQEMEWQATADLCEKMLLNKDVIPYWYQMPIHMTNNANIKERYNHCWSVEEKDKWPRERHPISIKENTYGTYRFNDLFGAIIKKDFAGKKAAYITGVRAEESPARTMGLTHLATYKHITWGKSFGNNLHYSFHPIYDWSYRDVWKYIHENKIEYNPVYDELYRHGANLHDMRVSSLHHEISIRNLLFVQEIEPETWNKIAGRVVGANTIKHLKEKSFRCPSKLPYMFDTWGEYTRHLIKNLVPEKKNREELNRRIESGLKIYKNHIAQEAFFKAIINTVLSADWDYTKLANFESSPNVNLYRAFITKNFKEGIRVDGIHMGLFTDKEAKQFAREVREWKSKQKSEG